MSQSALIDGSVRAPGRFANSIGLSASLGSPRQIVRRKPRLTASGESPSPNANETIRCDCTRGIGMQHRLAIGNAREDAGSARCAPGRFANSIGLSASLGSPQQIVRRKPRLSASGETGDVATCECPPNGPRNCAPTPRRIPFICPLEMHRPRWMFFGQKSRAM